MKKSKTQEKTPKNQLEKTKEKHSKTGPGPKTRKKRTNPPPRLPPSETQLEKRRKKKKRTKNNLKKTNKQEENTQKTNGKNKETIAKHDNNDNIEGRKWKQQANIDKMEKKKISLFLEKSPWYGSFTVDTPEAKKRKDNQQEKAKTNRQERRKS